MKKLIALTLCLVMVLCFSFAAMAATATTTYDAETGIFTTTVTADVGDQATLIAFPASGLDTTGSTNIEFIDQATTTAGATTFTYKFKNEIVANQAYTIKVGGSLLAEPLSETITPVTGSTGSTISGIISTVSPADIIGDVDMDALLNATTAVTVELFENSDDTIWGLTTVVGTPVSVDRTSGAFSFEAVADGSYGLKISRLGFLTRYVKVDVAGGNVDIGTKELYAGDFTEDYMINGDDSSTLFNTGAFDTDLTMAEYNNKLDISPDGLINGDDAAALWVNFDTDVTSYSEALGV